jgi:UrcA family protein
MVMTRCKIALLGAGVAAALFGVAQAQDYGPYSRDPNYVPYSRYDDHAYEARAYDDRVAPDTETVIVRPYYHQIEKRQIVGRVNGEVNPTEYTLSRPVSFADLDLTRDSDYLEFKSRVRDAARDMCEELDARVPQLRGDESADRECVRNATRNAVHQVLEREG